MKFSTHELENLARHTADAASEQQNQLLTIASASEEMSQTVQMIREHVHQTHDNAKAHSSSASRVAMRPGASAALWPKFVSSSAKPAVKSSNFPKKPRRFRSLPTVLKPWPRRRIYWR